MTETIGRDAETVGQTAPAESTGQAADRTGFHPLTVRSVEHLTEDSAAVTFDVPAEVAELFDFAAGQSLTLRRMIDGVEHRRTYSICAPAGAAPRIGVREIPDGLFSRWLVRDVRPGETIEVQPPSGSFRADASLGGKHLWANSEMRRLLHASWETSRTELSQSEAVTMVRAMLRARS